MIEDFEVYALAAANFGVYALLAFRLMKAAGKGRTHPGSAGEAFAQLGAEVRRTFPGISPGFTWREAIAESRKTGLAMDWPRLELEVDDYEGQRYGGKPESGSGYEEVGRLAKELRRIA